MGGETSQSQKTYIVQLHLCEMSNTDKPIETEGRLVVTEDLRLGAKRTVLVVSHSVVSDSCDPEDCSLPGSSVRGISQARILE